MCKPRHDGRQTTHSGRWTPHHVIGGFQRHNVIRASAARGTLSGFAYGRGSLDNANPNRAAEAGTAASLRPLPMAPPSPRCILTKCLYLQHW